MTTEDLSHVRTSLAEDFERQADWRLDKAAEYPDEGNERAAEGLRALAAYVRMLPDDDPRLRAIDAAWMNGDIDSTSPNMLLRSYGFGPFSSRDLPAPEVFFTWYAEEWSSELRIESLYRENPNRVRRLIIEDKAADDVEAVARRRTDIEMFRRLLDDADFFNQQIPRGRGPEAVWDKFLNENRWILGGSLSAQFLIPWDKKRLDQFMTGSSVAVVGKQTDALLRSTGLVHSIVFMEIKHHRTKLLGREYRAGCWSPSAEISGAVAQAQGTMQHTIADVESRLPELAADGSEIPGVFTYIIRPRSYLIAGNLSELFGEAGGINRDKYQSFQLYRRHTQEPEIITFDELLARAEGLVDFADVREGGTESPP
jgi:hypothetical protein